MRELVLLPVEVRHAIIGRSYAQENEMTAEAVATRCKMRVSEVTRSMSADGSVESERVKLTAVYSNDPENVNAQWSRWTPNGSVDITISNPAAMGKLSKGHEFYVDFTPAEVSA